MSPLCRQQPIALSVERHRHPAPSSEHSVRANRECHRTALADRHGARYHGSRYFGGHRKARHLNYFKTRTRFRETLGPVEDDLARIRLAEVLNDLARLKLIPWADYEQEEARDALFARLDNQTSIKLQAFVFTRCERKQKLIQRHPAKENKKAKEADFVSPSLKKSLQEEKATYENEFKNRVSCSKLV